MDADTLVKKAQQSIKNRDYGTARDYLKEAAGLAPLRSDIREMLEFVIQRQGGSRSSERTQRGPSQAEREQPRERTPDEELRNPERRSNSPRDFAPDDAEQERHRPSEAFARQGNRPSSEDRPTRGLFQTGRERQHEQSRSFSGSQPRERHSFLAMVVTFTLIALVVAGGAVAIILMYPGILHLPGLAGSDASPEVAGTTRTTPVAAVSPAADPIAEAMSSATSLVNQGNYEEAVQTLQKPLGAASPDEKATLSKHLSEVYFVWGKDLYQLSKLDESVEKLKLAAESDPQNAQIHYWLGEAYLLKGKSSGKPTLMGREADFAEAEKSLKEAIRLDGDMVKSYYTLGRTYAAKAQPEKAAEYYNEVIRRAPDSREADRARRDLRMMDMRTP